MLPSDSLAVISFDIITGAIVVVACFHGCIFAPESAIDRILLLGYFGGSPIQFVKLILGLLISILLIIAPNCHPHPLMILPSIFL